MGLEYIIIHVCRNDYILFRKQFEKLNQCPKYGQSCYNENDNSGYNNDDISKKCSPAKVLWYLSIYPRFKKPFVDTDDVKKLDGTYMKEV